MFKIVIGLLFMWTVSARSAKNVDDENAKLMENLPATRSQVEDLAENVCTKYFPDSRTSRRRCEDHFLNKPATDFSHRRADLKIRCRSQTQIPERQKIGFEVAGLDLWQLVVLIPENMTETEKIMFSLVEPNGSFAESSIENDRNYKIYSAVMDQDGGLSLWKNEGVLPLWTPEPRDYNIKVQYHNSDSEMDGIVGVFTWNQTEDLDACFEFVNYCGSGRRYFTKIRPNSLPTVQIKKMHFEDDCRMLVKGSHGKTEMKYRTPSSQNTPEKAHNVTARAVDVGGAWNVRVKWSPPARAPDTYNVTLRADRHHTRVLDGNATEVTFHNVLGKKMFNVSVYAVKGEYISHEMIQAPFTGSPEWRWFHVAAAAWCTVGLAIVAAALCWLRLRKRIYVAEKPQNIEGKPLEIAGDLEPLRTESWCEDSWEVKVERLVLHEVIGEGAFGVVRRGILAPAKKEVAVKMLKEFPSIDEIRSFRLEMDLMKSVGAHPHVVSLVGCCSGKRLLIVAEYCSRGDLLNFLRRSWDVMISKRYAKYYNNNMEASEYRNDLFKFKAQREHLVVNKLYDMQGINESELTALDLLSFCRQIAMGMEFLASNRLVHRDLAARNILVTGDRTLKIADFGLSRDVYEENQYQQKGNGKMPVKWMALESLTRRIYTTQSDVWSFGVVVWEVVTVGGAPYAGVAPARLPRLLRAGYRMPRPSNCSKQLYELMLSCWVAQPRARPTFAALHRRLDELLNCACADDYLCLELDEPPPPTSRHQRYFKMILRAKRGWLRGESYERPLKAPQSNHYTSSPVTRNPA